MISQDVDDYDNGETEYEYNEELTKSENVIASRRSAFPDLDAEYAGAIRTISTRVKCPMCGASKRQTCLGTMHGEPAHRCRLMLLTSSSPVVMENLKFAMKSKYWKGNNVVVKVNGKWMPISIKDSNWRKLVYESYGEECLDTHSRGRNEK
jgi:hypothetical protein